MPRPAVIPKIHEIEQAIKSHKELLDAEKIDVADEAKIVAELTSHLNGKILLYFSRAINIYFTAIEKMRTQNGHQRRLRRTCKKQVMQRVDGFDSLKTHMSTRVQQFFVVVCDIVGYYGHVEVDHNIKEIRMFVKKYNGQTKEETRRLVDEMIAKGQKNNIGSLSGGERSISTVMFLIALWKASASPFRCIDEYDVFMDTHHKQLATQLLCSYAANEPHVQLCFLTPTGLSDTKESLERTHGKIFSILTMKNATRPNL